MPCRRQRIEDASRPCWRSSDTDDQLDVLARVEAWIIAEGGHTRDQHHRLAGPRWAPAQAASAQAVQFAVRRLRDHRAR